MKKILISIAALAAISTSSFADIAEMQNKQAEIEGVEKGLDMGTKLNNPELWRAQNECKNPISYFNQQFGNLTFKKDIVMGRKKGGSMNFDMGTACINFSIAMNDKNFENAYRDFLEQRGAGKYFTKAPQAFMIWFLNKSFINNEETSDILFEIATGQKEDAIKLIQRNETDIKYIQSFYRASSIEEKKKILEEYTKETKFFRDSGKRYDFSKDIINVMKANLAGDKEKEEYLIKKIQDEQQ